MRNLNKTLAIVSLLAPASAHPLGVGDIKLHSALNQKLNAVIPLIVSKNENPANIRVSLAPPEKFDEAGVPWSYFLSKIKFKTQVLRNGAVVIKVTSDEALREPFLDFLLEVTWDKGNLYREFTVLVDPPSSYSQPVIPVAKPAMTQAAVTSSQPGSQQASEDRASKNIQVENELVAGGEYGPTKRSDTLWDIASKLRPRKDISIEQMMIALYEANPKAFYKDNVNALMAGKKLKVPDINSILKISRKQAARIFRQQYKEWTQKSTAVAKTSKAATSETVSKKVNQLELVAPTESSVDQSAQLAAQLETSKNAADQQKANEADIESSATEGLDNEALLKRLEKLEQQLTIMQQMLAVKDAQLALLQNKEKTGQVDARINEASTSKRENEPTQESKPVIAPVAKVTPVKKPVSAVKKPVKPVKKPAPVQQTEPESSFFTDFYYLIIGGSSLLIMGLLAWLWVRKRQAEEELDTESMFAASSQIIMPDSEISDEAGKASTFNEENQSAYDVGTVGESSFLSEFTPSDFDAFDAEQNEVEPIAEADVYLAYGRFQQAEELIRQAIEDHPDRKECKLKLLEIYYASENKDAFEAYVTELSASSLKDDADFWEKVEEMQKELGLEGGSTIASAAAAIDVVSNVNKDASETVDVSSAEKASEDVSEPGSIATDTQEKTEIESDAKANFEDDAVLDLSSLDDLDFDLNGFAENSAEQTEETKSADQEDIESLDFNLDFAAESAEEKAESSDEISPDTELETFDFQTETKEQTNKEEPAEDSFNFEESSFDVKTETEGESLGTEVSDLTDMDEFETKLDLAKAYIDMGDMDAAKSAAEEVLEKGNDQQKEAARKIIDSL